MWWRASRLPKWEAVESLTKARGKSGQIAGRMMGKGFLLSNEIEFSRARILLGNLERLGITNTCITCAPSDALS